MISDDEIIRAFGERLKEARIKRKMTQEELGIAIGADKSLISNYEKGHRRCSITTAFRLADALDVSFSFLMDKQACDFKHGQTEKDELTGIIYAIGRAIVDWGFCAYSDENFADFSTMHSIGLLEDSFGQVLSEFENLKFVLNNSDKDLNDAIYSAADACSQKLLQSGSFIKNIRHQEK